MGMGGISRSGRDFQAPVGIVLGCPWARHCHSASSSADSAAVPRPCKPARGAINPPELDLREANGPIAVRRFREADEFAPHGFADRHPLTLPLRRCCCAGVAAGGVVVCSSVRWTRSWRPFCSGCPGSLRSRWMPGFNHRTARCESRPAPVVAKGDLLSVRRARARHVPETYARTTAARRARSAPRSENTTRSDCRRRRPPSGDHTGCRPRSGTTL